jgi:enterochelin esterase-like enzyme
VDTFDISSSALGLRRRITVWVPSSLRPRSRHAVLYLNDGQNLFDTARAFAGVSWQVAETASWLIRRRHIPPLVVVGIDHGELRRARNRPSRTIAIRSRVNRWPANMRGS